jgi:hypothetical protein
MKKFEFEIVSFRGSHFLYYGELLVIEGSLEYLEKLKEAFNEALVKYDFLDDLIQNYDQNYD